MKNLIGIIHVFNREKNYAGRKNNGPERMTIAYGVSEDDELHIGIARCNPYDQYNKKIGRELAKKRFRENPVVIPREFIMEELIADIISDVEGHIVYAIKKTNAIKDEIECILFDAEVQLRTLAQREITNAKIAHIERYYLEWIIDKYLSDSKIWQEMQKYL